MAVADGAHPAAAVFPAHGANMATRKSLKKRQLILEMALKKFLAFGYTKTTLEDIGREVGLTKTALYHYFDSKETLLMEIVESIFERYLEGVRGIFSREIPFVEKFDAIIDLRREIVEDIFAATNTLVEDLFSVAPMLMKHKNQFDAVVIACYLGEIEKEKARGGITVDDPVAFANLIHVILNGAHANYLTEGLSDTVRVSQARLYSELKNLIRRGVSAHE
ncbi:TetR/AcrR family transcriptional regulator [Myxococcota bacterium]|nr:TetR/AcrR family transcriptional regulator [Myxococcota bacterium]MBU1536697.1 TetR/AcrR family transcriptional regulator [Myxococcota bacterium]